MGFSAPKPDPTIAAEQAAQAAQAKAQNIASLQTQLSNEDQVRSRLYGQLGNSLFGGARSQQGVSPTITSLLSGGFVK